jgi:phenol 2-monooxygenase
VLVILFPADQDSFGWTGIPDTVKERAEMKFYFAELDVYKMYGVDLEVGTVVIDLLLDRMDLSEL